MRFVSFYGAEMPDPVLLARMKARSKFVHGRGFAVHHVTTGWSTEGLFRMVSTIPIPMYKGDGDHDGLWDLLYPADIYLCSLLILGDALLHFGARCILQKKAGPGPGVPADLHPARGGYC